MYSKMKYFLNWNATTKISGINMFKHTWDNKAQQSGENMQFISFIKVEKRGFYFHCNLTKNNIFLMASSENKSKKGMKRVKSGNFT